MHAVNLDYVAHVKLPTRGHGILSRDKVVLNCPLEAA
jgi:hypothetical protein